MEGWCWCRKRMCSWCKTSSSSSSSSRLLLFMIPVLVLVVMVVVVGVFGAGVNGSSNWMFASSFHPWVWPSVIKSTSFSGNVTKSSYVIIEDPMSSPSPPKDTAHFNQELSSSGSSGVVLDGGGGGGGGTSDDQDAPSSSTSPPPLPGIEHIQITEKPVEQEEEILKFTRNSTKNYISTSFNETHAIPLSLRIYNNRRFNQLEKLEAVLRNARNVIRGGSAINSSNNQSYDPDYVPIGPMYWNANSFHGSYLEMEKKLKIYVYEEGEPPIFHNGPCKSIYAMEGNFIYNMEISKFRTKDPNKAHVFFLPISMTTIVHFIYDKKEKDHWLPLKQTVRDYVNLVAGKYPYWNRSLGADHFILACHDWGPELSKSVPELYENSIRCFCNANTSEGFNPSKDVSFPEIHLPGGTVEGLLGGPSPSKRPILAFFAGGLHGPIRPMLLEFWENKDANKEEEIQVHRYLPKGVSYYGMMKKSKYCICPSGYEVASPRIVEALYTGCVPVIIKDHYVAPFSDVLNWNAFSVDIPVKDIPNLKRILNGISPRQYIRMQRRGRQVRRHFEVSFPPKRYDVFHMILHSVWLRRLNTRLRHD